MANEVKLPRLGQGMESGTIVKWLKSEGEQVEKGEPLYELDTDKVTQEVEADASGVLLKIAVQEGEVEVGKTIAVIGKQGEQVEVDVSGNGAQAPPAPSEPATPRVQDSGPVRNERVERIKASPLALVERLRELHPDERPTVTDVLTRVTASALMRHRDVNAHFVDGEIPVHPSANIGIAVAAPQGLIVPVIRNAERLTIAEIARARGDLVQRTRDNKLKQEDLDAGTFTISNLGMFGVEQFIAVLNPPQVAILAVGSSEERVVVRDGAFVSVPTMTMTLTCDHRAIDGAVGADFLRTLKHLVEDPALAL